jgi:hypothetical protein
LGLSLCSTSFADGPKDQAAIAKFAQLNADANGDPVKLAKLLKNYDKATQHAYNVARKATEKSVKKQKNEKKAAEEKLRQAQNLDTRISILKVAELKKNEDVALQEAVDTLAQQQIAEAKAAAKAAKANSAQ